MSRSVSYNKTLLEQLKDPKEAAAYLNEALHEGDVRVFLKAFRKVAKARGGMARLASRAGYSRMGLYKSLSDRGNPRLKTVEEILAVNRLRFKVVPSTLSGR